MQAVSVNHALGEELYELAARIFPICRSITGDGVRRTIDILAAYAPFERKEVPTGTPVLDWEVPKEWNIRDGYIAKDGKRLVDFRRCNLHVLNYSTPINTIMSFSDLKTHLFTLPDQPTVIPYRTSYYHENWGFCIAHDQLGELERLGGPFEVVIDASLEPGHLTWGEYVLPGRSKREVLLTTHICHPSLANDNCSGLALMALLARELARSERPVTYRFLLIPGTIGSLTWLALNEAAVGNIMAGLVVSCVGDAGGPTYKRSRRGDTLVDRAFAHVLPQDAPGHRIIDFFPYGYDERQFCSPGFNLPVGLFQRSQFATYPQYHTSGDDLDFIKSEHLAHSYAIIRRAIGIIESDRVLVNLFPKGEPQLGRRGLYGKLGGTADAWRANMAMLWVLNLADGEHSLLDTAERAGLPFELVARLAAVLEQAGLVRPKAEAL
ncbi:MAG: DUF4910 domain-containing protein [Hyphomicrobiaceae bacterium]|nr:DUF4910 domain-containing protein [Hyphomicrobiaceae bacterium]